MFTYKLVCGLRTALVSAVITRSKGTGKGAGKGTATDPVQQLFLDKIREYRKKSPDDSFVDPSPVILKELESEMSKLEKNYGGGKGVDMTAFPAFKFEEPKLDPIDEVLPVTEGKKRKKKVIKKPKKAT